MEILWTFKARAENFEVELHRGPLAHTPGTIRLLGFVNHADMGSYRQAIARFQAGIDRSPDISAHPPGTREKYGFGINTEQSITPSLQLFGRWGWNNGRTESFAYTEVDQTLAFGGNFKGARWRRNLDKVGLALVSNGISGDHSRYLALGGKGFLLGDGSLHYGRENILEAYYMAHLGRGIYAGVDVQRIANPGYNRARGPVLVPGCRTHVEF